MKLLGLLFITSVVSFLFISSGKCIQVSGPSLIIDNKSFDFGSVPSDFKLIHSFKIRNAGTEPLKIGSILTNCDCTTASSLDSIIAPGDSSQIKMFFHTREYYGTTNRTISIESNDPQKPVCEIEYSANIDYFHKLHTSDPKYLIFLPGQGPKDIKLINQSDKRVEYILESEHDSVFILSKLSGEIKASNADIIKVTVNDKLKKGTYYSNFTVTYNTSPALRLTVPVKVVKY
jgi:hypothetical protein